MTEKTISKTETTLKFYSIDFEKLKGESIDIIAYFLGVMSFSEDYEYFDKIKHLLDIPPPRKSLEEIQKEFNEKIDALVVRTQEKFKVSQQNAEYFYNLKFEDINYNFNYAKENGRFPYKLDYTTLSVFADGSGNVSFNTQYRVGDGEEGYWDIPPNIQVYLRKKPNPIVRYFTKLLLNFTWKDVKK